MLCMYFWTQILLKGFYLPYTKHKGIQACKSIAIDVFDVTVELCVCSEQTGREHSSVRIQRGHVVEPYSKLFYTQFSWPLC